MKEGNLPSRDGNEISVDFNHEANKIIVEVNGEKEELSIVESITFAGKILAMVEVVIVNDA